MNKIHFILLCFYVSVQADLTCYDCDPSSPGKCLSPVENNIKMTRCPNTGIQNCFSVYYTPKYGSNAERGVYRGCYEDNTNLVCNHIQKTLTDGTISWCKFCVLDKCNTDFPYKT